MLRHYNCILFLWLICCFCWFQLAIPDFLNKGDLIYIFGKSSAFSQLKINYLNKENNGKNLINKEKSNVKVNIDADDDADAHDGAGADDGAGAHDGAGADNGAGVGGDWDGNDGDSSTNLERENNLSNLYMEVAEEGLYPIAANEIYQDNILPDKWAIYFSIKPSNTYSVIYSIVDPDHETVRFAIVLNTIYHNSQAIMQMEIYLTTGEIDYGQMNVASKRGLGKLITKCFLQPENSLVNKKSTDDEMMNLVDSWYKYTIWVDGSSLKVYKGTDITRYAWYETDISTFQPTTSPFMQPGAMLYLFSAGPIFGHYFKGQASSLIYFDNLDAASKFCQQNQRMIDENGGEDEFEQPSMDDAKFGNVLVTTKMTMKTTTNQQIKSSSTSKPKSITSIKKTTAIFERKSKPTTTTATTTTTSTAAQSTNPAQVLSTKIENNENNLSSRWIKFLDGFEKIIEKIYDLKDKLLEKKSK